MLGRRGLLKSQQNEQGVDGNTQTNLCESLYPSWNYLSFQCVRIMRIKDSRVPTYHAT